MKLHTHVTDILPVRENEKKIHQTQDLEEEEDDDGEGKCDDCLTVYPYYQQEK